MYVYVSVSVIVSVRVIDSVIVTVSVRDIVIHCIGGDCWYY